MAWPGGGVTDTPSYIRRSWKKPLMADCVLTLKRDGWQVYTRGMPTVIAEKGNFMRMIVVDAKVVFGKGRMLSRNRQALSEAFYKCFGVKFEIWNNPEEPKKEEEWV